MKVLNDARAESNVNGGTIVLVQGPPGAGKTALLHECGSLSRAAGWLPVRISSKALYDADTLARRLKMSHATKVTKRTSSATHGGLSTLLTYLFQRQEDPVFEDKEANVEQILIEAATPDGLLVILDEAQNLKLEIEPESPEKRAVVRCLNQINNGTFGAPIVLLAGGLDTSQEVFEAFGVSRLTADGVHHLGALDDVSTREIIRDRLVKSGGAQADHEHLDQWIRTLAAASYGWPQHIQRYSMVAAQWLLDNGSAPSPQVPEAVLIEGREKREDYYRARVMSLDRTDVVVLANLLRQTGPSRTLKKDDIVAELSTSKGREKAEEVFELILSRGVIAEDQDKFFSVPIPSMHSWLVHLYANEQAKRLPAPSDELPARPLDPKHSVSKLSKPADPE